MSNVAFKLSTQPRVSKRTARDLYTCKSRDLLIDYGPDSVVTLYISHAMCSLISCEQ